MDPGVAMQIMLLIALIACSAFFSSSETALVSVSRIRLRTLVKEGSKRAELTLKLTENQPKMLSAILIGNNIANLSASALSTSLTLKLFGSAAVAVATGILTVLILIFGEITPKNMATVRAERLSMLVTPIIYALMTVLTPIIFVINSLSAAILKLFGINMNSQRKALSASEIRTVMDVGHETGVIQEDEKEIINNVFDFRESTVREIMIPRIDMACVSIDCSYQEVMDVFREDKHTRIPVFMDSIDQIVGILNVKDLLLCDADHFSLKGILRKAYFTYEHKNTSQLFMEMKKNSIAMTIVLDDYGATAGMVTMEDLLEEIVGEIHDEYDSNDDAPIRQIAENEYLVEGSTDLDDLNEALGLDLHSDDYDSIGGYMIEHFDRIPKIREAFYTEDGVFLQIQSKTNHRIDLIRLKIPKKLSHQHTLVREQENN